MQVMRDEFVGSHVKFLGNDPKHVIVKDVNAAGITVEITHLFFGGNDLAVGDIVFYPYHKLPAFKKLTTE
jgi:hypothetical protein